MNSPLGNTGKKNGNGGHQIMAFFLNILEFLRHCP